LSSNHGRYLLEGKVPSFEKAVLMVGLCGMLARFLSRKV